MDEVDLQTFQNTPLAEQPFQHLVVPGFVKPEACLRIHKDYPVIEQPGSFPVEEVTYGPAFNRLLETLRSSQFRAAFEEKFNLDLSNRPLMMTVRGQCGPRDGSIHTDATSKIITVLIYMNGTWEAPEGRLRLLRSPTDIEDVISEVPPGEGTLVAFRRSDNSYHGHKPFIGPRRVIQLNWVTSLSVRRYENIRHRVSAMIKKRLAA